MSTIVPLIADQIDALQRAIENCEDLQVAYRDALDDPFATASSIEELRRQLDAARAWLRGLRDAACAESLPRC